MWKNKDEPDRSQMTTHYGVCALHAGKLGVYIHTRRKQYFLLFHSNNGCTNVPQCYVIRTSTVLFKPRRRVFTARYEQGL